MHSKSTTKENREKGNRGGMDAPPSSSNEARSG
jgi:hypothetical protein